MMTHPYEKTGFEAILYQRKTFLINEKLRFDTDFEAENVDAIQLSLPLLSARGMCKGIMTTRQFHLVEVGENTLICLRRENVGREQICLELKIESNTVSNSSRLTLRYWSATGLMMALWIRQQLRQFEAATSPNEESGQLQSATSFTFKDRSVGETGYECDARASNHSFSPLSLVDRCYPG